ncbi:MAG: glucosaminidase domain-containing protein [Saprospiraceae bacterium]|nr:glucosaminidase domain-containing protein [Saprospiraceae bacterium]
MEEVYIYTFRELAVQEMCRSGIPASIILAQAIVESEFGTSDLALKSNNHFGIKCNDEWSKEVVYHYDDDHNSQGVLIPSCFRKYPAIYDSFIDHTNFLLHRKYYKSLFRYPRTDYKHWAHGLEAAGYATDPLYGELLIETIEEYRLFYYDFLRPDQVAGFRF